MQQFDIGILCDENKTVLMPLHPAIIQIATLVFAKSVALL